MGKEEGRGGGAIWGVLPEAEEVEERAEDGYKNDWEEVFFFSTWGSRSCIHQSLVYNARHLQSLRGYSWMGGVLVSVNGAEQWTKVWNAAISLCVIDMVSFKMKKICILKTFFCRVVSAF